MTNGEKLIKEHPDFVAHRLAKCDFYGVCEVCPLYVGIVDCSDEEEIAKWLRSEVKEDD